MGTTRVQFRIGLFLLLLGLTVALAWAQAPDTVWTRRIGTSTGSWIEEGITTPGGGYLALGMYTRLGTNNWDSWLVKFNANCDTTWTKLYGGAYGEYGRDIVRMADTGFVILGKKQTVQNGDYYVWLYGLDTSGNKTWEKITTKTENPWGLTLAADTGFGIVASRELAVTPMNDIVVIRANSKGDTVWSRRFGGPLADDPETIVATPDSGFLILANTRSYGLGNGDVYLLKVNKRGDSVWARTFGGAQWDDASQMRPTSDGNYLIVGVSYSFGVSGSVYVIKVSPEGGTLWESNVAGPGGTAVDFEETPDGGFLLTGTKYPGISSTNDVYIVRIDKDGKLLWSKSVGTNVHEGGICAHRTPDGSSLIVGNYGSSNNIYAVKLAPEVVEVKELAGEIPATIMLHQNYPNPFNPVTMIRFELPRRLAVRLSVFNLLGQELAVLVDEELDAGLKEVAFDASSFSSGSYFCRLHAGTSVLVKKLLLVR